MDTTTEDGELLELGNAPLLKSHEEIALAIRLRNGDASARNELVLANVRLVLKLAHSFKNRGLPFADLVQEGMFGLIRAAEGFDPDLGYRFGTYASFWIRQSIGRAASMTGRTIRLPINVGAELSKIRRADRTLSSDLARQPSLEEVAKATQSTVARISELLAYTRAPRSLSEPVGTEGDELGMVLSESVTKPADEALAEVEIASKIRQAMKRLSPREQRIVSLRFGLGDQRDHSLEEIGQMFNLSRERVRQIETVALKKLSGVLSSLFSSEREPEPELEPAAKPPRRRPPDSSSLVPAVVRAKRTSGRSRPSAKSEAFVSMFSMPQGR